MPVEPILDPFRREVELIVHELLPGELILMDVAISILPTDGTIQPVLVVILVAPSGMLGTYKAGALHISIAHAHYLALLLEKIGAYARSLRDDRARIAEDARIIRENRL